VSPPASGRTAGRPVALPDILDFLDRVAGWDTAAWSRQKERFESTFGILPMTPPNQPGPVVLQATIGDSGENPVGFGGSASCPLYVRDSDEFHRHLESVKHLWHRRMPQARGIYLAGSELIHQPMPKVLEVLDEVQKNLAELTIDSPARLIDPPPTLFKSDLQMLTFSPGHQVPTVEMLTEYRHRGLVHITIAIESVLQSIRAKYGRNWPEEQLASFINNCNESGLKYSLVLLVGGEGGSDMQTGDDALAFFDRLPVESGTLVYLLDAAETATPAWKQAMNIADSNSAALFALRDQLATHLKERKIRVLHYTLEKEWQ
ncbi:MAG: hypothetical protein ACKO5E_18245, partial [bacterium]